jgi:excinuclease ABC subunit A
MQLSAMTPDQLRQCLETEPMTDWQRQRIKCDLKQVFSRIGYLQQTGLGSLPLDAPLRELSDGEKRRVTLTEVLASPLVDVLFVLDEPSLGLTTPQTENLLGIIRQLRDRGNTVIVIDHHPVLLLNADHIVELGPGAGADGGQIVFQGTVEEMLHDENSLTGRYLADRTKNKKRPKIPGLSNDFDGKTVNNSQHYILTTDIPRTSTSNPATYLKFFDEIRSVFAGTPDAKAKNITARHFSFNVTAGRCEHCKGSGTVTVEMQFLPSQIIRCSECNGKRFQPQVLEILYRSKTITEVLEMTAREAFGFFRGHSKVQRGLKLLLDVGLDYIQIGQPVNTLSGGEVQRLKLATFLSHLKGGIETIYIDEPTAGLHFADIDILIECFRTLTQTGHKIIVNTHNEQLLAVCEAADDTQSILTSK